MRPLEFGWYLPTHGDTTAYGLVEAEVPGSPELCDRVVQAAEAAGFDVLITVDQDIPDQQNLSQRSIALVILCGRTNRLKDLDQGRGRGKGLVTAALCAGTGDHSN